MSQAFRCDRCKEFETGTPAAVFSLQGTHPTMGDIVAREVCGHCRDELKYYYGHVVRAAKS